MEKQVMDESREYQICRMCIMDSSDLDISFLGGVCNHCFEYQEKEKNEVHYGDYWENSLRKKIAKIRDDAYDKEYDCVIGLSGGMDSSYAILKAVEFGLKPFVIIVDNGYDTEQSKNNVDVLLKYLNLGHRLISIDNDEYHDMQLSFLKASVINAEAPTDHLITAILYKTAMDMGLKWILTGGNVVTEAILPKAWGYDAKDWHHIKAVQKKFGKYNIDHFPHLTMLDWFYATFVRGIKFFPILNWIPYNKEEAGKELSEKTGWMSYGQKHMESVYTRWFQGYLLPVKFGIDKRRAHLSTLINSGQISRKKALTIMEEPYYTDEMMESDWKYICKKLKISSDTLFDLVHNRVREFSEYPNNSRWFNMFRGLVAVARLRAIAN